MHIVIYNNQTKHIVNLRHDDSIGIEKPTPQWWLEDFVKSQNLSIENYSVTTVPYDDNAKYILGRDMFDETTQTIVADPSWVAPPEPTPTPVTPVEPTV